MQTPPGRTRLGLRGEEAAAALLTRAGYRIIARNYRCPLGELDLVAEDRGEIIFVEVKTRRTSHAGRPVEAVNGRKRARLVRLARFYLAVHDLQDRPCRFDVVSVEVRPGSAHLTLLRGVIT
jgi:putative endonuclease